MKVKIDFVTNSSSTCYIISSPKNLEIKTGNQIVDDLIDKFLEYLNQTGFAEFGWQACYPFPVPYEDNETMDLFIDTLSNIFIDYKYIITEFECGCDSPTRIVDINSDFLKSKIFDKMTLLFDRLEEARENKK